MPYNLDLFAQATLICALPAFMKILIAFVECVRLQKTFHWLCMTV